MFLIGYGTFRFIAEFARQPDAFLGILAFGLIYFGLTFTNHPLTYHNEPLTKNANGLVSFNCINGMLFT